PRAAEGLLRWLEGDVLLEQGAEDRAIFAHRGALHALDAEGLREAALLLARRCADRYAGRGATALAQEWLERGARPARLRGTEGETSGAIGAGSLALGGAERALRAGQ